MRDKLLATCLALLGLGTLAHCKADDQDKTCTGATAAALTSTVFRGSSLPPKTIALTFDDGPSERTAELSLYLKSEGIEAGFFVNGMRIDASMGPVLQGLIDDGHIVGNHTETHLSLTGATDGKPRPSAEAVLAEIASTDAKIASYVPTNRWLFRPPYGDFDQATLDVLAPTPMNKYVGPISWDVGDHMDEAQGRAADWDCWQDGTDAKRLTVEQCGDLYFTEIKRAGRGIVLLHDPYVNDLDPQLRGTVDMIKYLVPKLKAEGFAFKRVDKIPDIDAKLTPLTTPGATDAGASSSGGPNDNATSSNGGAANDTANAGTDNPCP